MSRIRTHLALCLLAGTMLAQDKPQRLLHLQFEGPGEIAKLGGRVVGKAVYRPGKVGQGYLCTGKDGHLEVLNRDRLRQAAGTIELWFQMVEKPVPGSATILFDAVGTFGWWDRFVIQLGRSDKGTTLQGSVIRNKSVRYGADTTLKTLLPATPGAWHHLAMTWMNVSSGRRDAEVRLYLDGTEVLCQRGQDLAQHTLPEKLLIGDALNWTARPKKLQPVLIDELQIWDQALAAHQIAGQAKLADRPAMPKTPTLRIRPTTAKKPVIDGTLAPDEWSTAQLVTLFRDYNDTKGPLVPWQTKAWLTYDATHLYLAWRCQIAEKAPRGSPSKRDASLWTTDSMELVLAPDAEAAPIIHFIGNAWDSIYDERFRDPKARDRAWNANWLYKSSRNAGEWQGELRIAFADLEVSPPQPGDTWRFNLCRNGFTPQAMSMWSHCPSSFLNAKTMAALAFSGPGIVLSDLDLPAPSAGPNQATYVVRNTAKTERPFRFELGAIPVADPEAAGTTRLRRLCPAGAKSNGTIDYTLARAGAHDATLLLRDLAEKATAWEHPFRFTAATPLGIEVHTAFPDGVVEVTLDTSRLRGGPFTGTLSLLPGRDAKPVRTEDLPAFTGRHTIKLQVRDLPAGTYTVRVELTNARRQPAANRAVPLEILLRPTCVKPKAGITGVVAPWTPLTVDGDGVSCWNRTYTFAQSPLPTAIRSNQEELLAAPIHFAYRANGTRYTLAKGTSRIINQQPDRVELQGTMGDERLQVEAKARLEFDGALIYHLTVTPKTPLDVEDFSLVVPLRTEWAQYFMNCHAETFSEEQNRIPQEPGKRLESSFMGMFGVGCVDRGLQWFCESDEGWEPYDRPDTIVLERQADRVLLRFQIKGKTRFDTPLKLVCGFVATPTRPIPAKTDFLRVYHYWPGGPYREIDPPGYNIKLDVVAKGGAKVLAIHEWWAAHYGSAEPAAPAKLKELVEKAHALGMRVVLYRSALGSMSGPAARYYGDRWLARPTREWRVRPGARPEMSSVGRCSAAPEYADWLLGAVDNLITNYDIDGLYYDWGVGSCRNHEHGCGYKPRDGVVTKMPAAGTETEIIGITYGAGSAPFAAYRRTNPILAHRQLWKRLYSLVKQRKGERGIITAHSDSPGSMVYLSFVDSAWHSEDITCHMKKPWLPTPAQYQLFMSKQHLGLPSEILCYAFMNMGPYDSGEESLAVSMLHGEWNRPQSQGHYAWVNPKNYGPVSSVWRGLDRFGIDGARWVPYWRNQTHVRDAPDRDIRVSLWERPSQVLLVVSNLKREPQTAQVTILPDQFANGTAVDAQTGEKLTLKGDQLTVPLPALHMRLVHILPAQQ